ncbi:XrtA system polysaccharide deacetylase [Chitinivibrio alkaliphilus]|uniref:Polysaccharide deacetylase n=1 Tax=Chitinivibrio alkaliphilus ACht1 TaxID=1313304 RepID=U7DC20_9BACT|nr:XrtA system polysaccharide deacetylase [Chitinivibrio alkaliphilus]ERP39128.1 polysaccharide deacetylase [Chitinivibrio alkaliphilus ACht1]
MTCMHALSIDLEDWFMVQNFANRYSHADWDRLELRVAANTAKLLDLFDECGVRATFFVLGWIAHRLPDLITEIEHRGHEIGTHGYGHERVIDLGPEAFRRDLFVSLEHLARCAKNPIIGFRAPSFSVDPTQDWIFKTLSDAGILYDSSLFPVPFHPDYANAGVPLEPYEIRQGLMEFPMTCIPRFGMNIPCSGGGYFRMFPYQWFKYGFRHCEKHGRPGVFYLHPWEIDPGQPRVTGLPLSKRFRHYVNQHKTYPRLRRLLHDFSFSPLKDVLELG